MAVVAASLSIAGAALADAWRVIPDAARFARPGAPTIQLEIHSLGMVGCGGGGCSTPVEVRNVRGTLPAHDASYYYSDRPGRGSGCFASNDGTLFSQWSEAEIAPIAGGQDARPECGIAVGSGASMRYFVIIRVRRSAPGPHATSAPSTAPLPKSDGPSAPHLHARERR